MGGHEQVDLSDPLDGNWLKMAEIELAALST
jgi:hypothetical protein